MVEANCLTLTELAFLDEDDEDDEEISNLDLKSDLINMGTYKDLIFNPKPGLKIGGSSTMPITQYHKIKKV